MAELTLERLGAPPRSIREGAGVRETETIPRQGAVEGFAPAHLDGGPGRPADVEVDILGPLVWRVAGTPVALAPKLRSLLALLALQSGHAVSVTEIATTLWGDDCLSNARKSIQVLVYRLRTRMNEALEAAGRPPLGEAVITTAGDTYTLRLCADVVDARRFEGFVVRGRAAMDCRPGEADGLFETALGLWRGDALADLSDSDTGLGERTRLEELRRGAEEDLVQCRLALGRHAELTAVLEAGVVAHPLRERRWGQLMVALYRSGRQADALRAFQRARATLVDELGIEPGEDLRRLESAIIAQDPALDLMAWRDPAAVGPAPTPSPRLSNVAWARRQQEVPLVGRRDELGYLRRCWQQVNEEETAAVVLVSGDAGMGKTRLAAELALEADARGALVLAGCCSPDVEGSGWCEAIGYFARHAADPERAAMGGAAAHVDTLGFMAPGLVDHLGAVAPDGDPGSRRLAAALTGFLGALASQQPVLVVLDDLHLGGRMTLRVLTSLIRGLPGHAVMVVGTYRGGCGVTDEAHDDLLELGTALRHVPIHGHVEVGGLSCDDAVTLLVERLHAAGLEMGDAEGTTLASEAGGNPLYLIELARATRAGRGTVPVPIALRRLVDQRLRHLGVAADLLSMASVIGATFSLATISEVSGMSEDRALDLLDRAVAAGLISEVADPGYAFANGLERQVLADRLTAGRRSWLHRRLAGVTESTPRLIPAPTGGQDATTLPRDRGPEFPDRLADELPGPRVARRPELISLMSSADGVVSG